MLAAPSSPGAPVRTMAVQRLRAAGRVALLLDMKPEAQQDAISEQERFQAVAIVERLIELSLGTQGPFHPDHRLALGRLALSVTHRLARTCDAAEVAQLTARGYGCLGNAHRLRGDMVRAAQSFRRARKASATAPDAPTEAFLLGLEAEWSKDRGHYAEASDQLERAEALALQAGLDSVAADARWRRAVLQGLAGDHLVAVEALVEAEAWIDRAEHPRSFLCARHHRIWYLDEAGHTEEAVELYDASAGLYRSFGDETWFPIQRKWLEARLAYGCGFFEEAQALASEVWTTAFTSGLQLDTVLISLDLSKAYVRQGRFAVAWQLASRLMPLLQSWGAHRRIVEAFGLLRHGFGAQTATVEIVEEIRAFVIRGWRNPEMPFR